MTPAKRVVALVFGGAVTLGELFFVARLSAPAEHPEAQAPERGPPPTVVSPPPPRPQPAAPAPAPTERAARAPRAPAPDLAPAALPRLADAHLEADLGSALPGLSLGGLGAALDAAPPPSAPPPAKVPAQPRQRPAPTYPRAARRQGIEGFVVVRLRIDASGRVVDAVVVDAEPEGVFERAALRAARRYRYTPAQVGGRAVPDTLEQRLVFRLR